ncbi:MAG: hypothetical protein M1302_04065 [Candidatus Thermoplasmatota archaeon]|nr:hypothetical protein [Candidatus Thermoplasmatota archaeon]
MFLSDEQDLRRLCREINLTDSETEEVLNNSGNYTGILEKIRMTLQVQRKLLVEKTELETKIASMNYSNYELYMAAHTNAIAISGILGEARIKGIMIPGSEMREIKRILDDYLMIRRD